MTKLTAEQEKEIVQLRDNGVRVIDIRRQFEIGHCSYKLALRNQGRLDLLEKKSAKSASLSEKHKEVVLDYLRCKIPREDIAEVFMVKVDTINKIADDNKEWLKNWDTLPLLRMKW